MLIFLTNVYLLRTMPSTASKLIDQAIDVQRREVIKKLGKIQKTTKNSSKTSNVATSSDEPEHTILADMNVCSRVWPACNIEWVHITDPSIELFQERVLSLLERQRPQRLTILAYQLFLRDNLLDEMVRSIELIMETAAASKRHRVTVSTLRFNPDEERLWHEVGDINRRIREIMDKHRMQPLLAHKIFIQKDDDIGGYTVKANFFAEYMKGTSLGTNPNEKGLNMLADWLRTHHRIGIDNRNVLPLKSEAVIQTPCPLGLTPSFFNNNKMTSFLKSRGMFVRHSRSETRKPLLRRTSHRTISRTRPESIGASTIRQGRSATRHLENLLANAARINAANPHHSHDHSAPHLDVQQFRRLQEKFDRKCQDFQFLEEKHRVLKGEMASKVENFKRETDIKDQSYKAQLDHYKQMYFWADQEVEKLRERLQVYSRDLSEMTDRLNDMRLSKKDKKALRRQQKDDQTMEYN